MKFGTLEYFQKVAEAVNANEEMTKSKMNLTMKYTITDRTLPNGSVACYFLKFENGKVVEVRESNPTEYAEMMYEAKSEIYQRLFNGTLKFEDAQRTGWFKVNYALMKALRYKTAMETYSKIIPTVQAEF